MVQKDNLYTYLDNIHNLAIHLFKGEEFVTELLATHGVSAEAQPLVKELILSLQSLIVFLKDKESLGVYIDSHDPKFTFKLESNGHGHSRILILPENFNDLKKVLSGNCQLTKFSPPENIPYTSLIDFKNKQAYEILNDIFNQSYQMDTYFVFKDEYDFLLIHKLPGSDDDLKLEEFVKNNIFDLDNADKFQFLSSKKVSFQCNCSKERFIQRIKSLSNKQELINEAPLEIKCDYCKKEYSLSAKDLTD